MKAESQERIWKAIDGAYTKMSDGKSREKQVAEVSEFLQFIQSVLNVASTPEKLKPVLDSVEEPSEDELVAIENIIAFIPKFLPRMIAEKICTKAAALTKERTPGRKRSIPEERYSEVCNEVSSLIRMKVSTVDAKQRIASRHGVSPKTIDRIWSKRDQYCENVQMTSNQTREMLDEILREAFSPTGWKESHEAIILALK